MPNIAFPFFFLWASLIQSAGTTPLRTGDLARQLTEQDVAELNLVLPSGERPWLLNGDPGQIPNAQFVEAYLSPTSTTPALRRGTVITVMRRIAPPLAWTAQRAESYAQVAVAGRNFDQILGDQDINRPFRIIGRFEDTELVRLVEFLRSKSTPSGQGPNSVQAWPILSMTRQTEDSVRVMLRGAVMQGQVITLSRAGPDWVVVAVGMWIV